ncbi:MAG: succinylglutamate desuccinylase/aspartoacylase family protein [Verrucomicrobiae bacterium]|nr:succinylglutamate desuccinylase/aspartoacylase family protein [Verrucomicrobiae bacterium]
MSIDLRRREFVGSFAGPRLLVTGGVHGDEFEPMAAIRRLIQFFDAFDGTLCGRLTLVPVVNEAAFLRGHRCAEEDGLDLARTCPGDPEGTVTEQAANALSQLIRQSDLYIDLHTGGTELAVSPLTGYMMVDAPDILDTQRRLARAMNLPIIWGTAADLDGRSMSVARDAGIPAIYAEYLGSATCSDDGVEAYFEGVLNVMAEFGMIDRVLLPTEVRHVIEDTRPGSGHMQVCHPSPIDGCFEPAIALGASIKKGEPLGQVVDLLGGESYPIPAEENGVVIVLRTFPRVRKGESCGVIMHTDG